MGVPLFVHHQIPVAVIGVRYKTSTCGRGDGRGSCDSVVTSVVPYRIRLSVALVRKSARPLPCRRRRFCTRRRLGAILWRPNDIGSRNVAFIATRRHPFAGMPVCAITSRCWPASVRDLCSVPTMRYSVLRAVLAARGFDEQSTSSRRPFVRHYARHPCRGRRLDSGCGAPRRPDHRRTR